MVPTNDSQIRRTRRAAMAFIVAAAATAVAGAVLQFGLQPATELSDDMWRYPWSSSGAFVAFSLFSALLHGLVIVGLVAFGAAAQPDDHEPRPPASRSRSPVRRCCWWASWPRCPFATPRSATPALRSSAPSSGSPASCRPSASSSPGGQRCALACGTTGDASHRSPPASG